jgi:hypothetical protein
LLLLVQRIGCGGTGGGTVAEQPLTSTAPNATAHTCTDRNIPQPPSLDFPAAD